jgi:N-acetylmuramoyl-L-alanine amidase
MLGAADTRAEGIRVVYEDGREQEKIPVWSVDEIPYLSVNDVGRILGATKQWNSETKKMVLRSGESQTTLTLESPVVLAGEDARRSLHPVRMRRGILHVPLDLVTRVLPESFGQGARWDPATGTLRVGSGRSNVAPPRFKKLPRGIRAILPLTEPLEYSMDPEAVGGFQLTLKGAKADPDQISRSLHRGFVKRVSASQRSDRMEILFIPDRDDLQARVVTQRDPAQVVVDITAPDDLEVPSPRLKPRWALSPDEVLGRDREKWALELVVIDPGHGGVDTGARGVSGLEEKQVVLEVARQLEIMLEDRSGIEAVLTRERDEFVPLRQRTEMANTLEADLFVSIHCNASSDPKINGFEVYFQSLEMGEEEQLVAEFENAVLALEGETSVSAEGDLPFILWDLAQNAFMAESSDFADLVQGALGNAVSTRNRGVKQANFVVLRGAHMPAVLVEGAFATNESEEALLRSPYFQQSLAEGLYEGIMQFKTRYEGHR